MAADSRPDDGTQPPASRFRLLLEHSPEAVVIVDSAGTIVAVNRLAAALFGYRHAALLGLPVETLVPEQARVAHAAIRKNAPGHATARPLASGLRLVGRRADGSEFPAEIALSQAPLDRDYLVIATVRDLTTIRDVEVARDNALRALKASEAAFRRLAENSPDIIAARQIFPEERLTYVSSAVHRILGYQPEELISNPRKIIEIIEGQDRALLPTTDHDDSTYTVRFRHADGHRVWLECHRHLIRDEHGRAVAAETIARDVTDRRAAEERRARVFDREHEARVVAEESRSWYRALFERAADPMLVADAGHAIIEVNQAACDALGYSPDELIGHDVWMITTTHGDARAGQEAEFAQRGSIRREAVWRRKDGSTFPVDVCVQSIQIADGALTHIAGRDISERRAVEKLQQDFLALVSHELMNPVTGIGLHAELLEMRKTYRPESVHAIAASARQLERLVGDLLNVARIESGRLSYRPRLVDLMDTVTTCVELARVTATDHDLRVSGPKNPIVGWWDRERIEEVLNNLISNAIKYSPAGTAIDVVVEGDESLANVAVVDRGHGIPADILPQIFNRFYRNPSDEQSVRGLGLGLYVTRAIVRAHGGEITAESELGKGTTIRFTLPFHHLPEPGLPTQRAGESGG
ncbi:MAG: PAS domain-containing sensor histidine kinase [Chloroflexota bacterium]